MLFKSALLVATLLSVAVIVAADPEPEPEPETYYKACHLTGYKTCYEGKYWCEEGCQEYDVATGLTSNVVSKDFVRCGDEPCTDTTHHTQP
ncbi:hypothetical protein DFQ26_007556 [Actinomortierella ambigua]|nr:hypothetical protein DFQ26_007556 [Actinomortierella ambigua]